MISNIEEVNYNFTFKGATSQPGNLYFVEYMINQKGYNESYNHWNLVRIRQLNGKKTIMSIWFFKRNRAPYGRLIKYKSRLCTYGGMHKWGVNYFDTYSPVVNWVSVGVILTLSILREIHTKSVFFFWPAPRLM